MKVRGKYKREGEFQSDIKEEIEKRLPGCIITKLDSSIIQGIPDLLILYNNKWATLECKKDYDSPYQPNQKYYIKLMNDMSFSRRISQENWEEVLNELQSALST